MAGKAAMSARLFYSKYGRDALFCYAGVGAFEALCSTGFEIGTRMGDRAYDARPPSGVQIMGASVARGLVAGVTWPYRVARQVKPFCLAFAQELGSVRTKQ
jgi:hypothetical protein